MHEANEKTGFKRDSKKKSANQDSRMTCNNSKLQQAKYL